MVEKKNSRMHGKELYYFCLFSMALLFVAAFLFSTPKEILLGMKTIILSRDALVTDYFELAGYGAGFFNAALITLHAIVLIQRAKIPYTGLTLAVIFINMGFGFWGKNPVNIIPIIFGTWLYAKLHHVSFARYVYTALFATCLSPFVTELVYILPFSPIINLCLAIIIGIVLGFSMPPLAAHTASMHMGYSLFNVGFAGGTLAFVSYCILRAHGITSESVFIWKAEKHPAIVIGALTYFIFTFFVGYYLEGGKEDGLRKVMQHPGRSVTDFVMMDGKGVTLMNMGIMGILAEVYVLLVDGDMSGPILGCILTVFGFSAFGAHLRNYVPVLLGVYLSTFFSIYTPNTPGILIASMFVVGISPIAGQFGPVAGVLAGLLHSSIVMCTSQMYGGLNLYNNGFSCGWVAIVMVPLIESFMKQFKKKNHRR